MGEGLGGKHAKTKTYKKKGQEENSFKDERKGKKSCNSKKNPAQEVNKKNTQAENPHLFNDFSYGVPANASLGMGR